MILRKVATVDAYLAGLAPERRRALQELRKLFRANLDGGFEERIQYGMISYCVPHKLYPAGYHCDPSQPLLYAAIGSQKNHMAIYFMSIYGDEKLAAWFRDAWKKTGKRLDMGKSCVRFKKLDDLALDVLAEALRRVPLAKFVSRYEALLSARGKPRRAKPSSKKAVVSKRAEPTAANVKKRGTSRPKKKPTK